MKKNIHIGAVLAMMLLFACDAALEVEPQNQLKPTTFADYDELLNYGYPTSKEYATTDPLDFYVEFMTDDADIRFFNPDRNAYGIIPFSWSDTHEDPSMLGGYDQAWKYFYNAIYYANVVIENIDEADGSERDKQYLKGEAMALRAFSYFKLINLYAAPFNSETAVSDLGVPLKLDAVVQAESYTRNTVKEIYDQIDQDMQLAIPLLKDNDRRLVSKYKIGPLAAELLASRIALYKQDYTQTIAHATEVIKENPRLFDLSGYVFNEARNWGYGGQTNYFADDKDNILFKFGSNEYYNYFYLTPTLALSDDLINSYEPGDIRLYYFSYPSGIGRAYYKYRPYPMYPGNQIRAFRVEEAFLNRAEAYAWTGNLQAALDDINYLRRYKFDSQYDENDPEYYVYTLDGYPTKESVIQLVRMERRRELCFEFHRWYDLRRYGMPAQTHEYSGEEFKLKEKDPRYILQIPQRELDYNSLMQRNER